MPSFLCVSIRFYDVYKRRFTNDIERWMMMIYNSREE